MSLRIGVFRRWIRCRARERRSAGIVGWSASFWQSIPRRWPRAPGERLLPFCMTISGRGSPSRTTSLVSSYGAAGAPRLFTACAAGMFIPHRPWIGSTHRNQPGLITDQQGATSLVPMQAVLMRKTSRSSRVKVPGVRGRLAKRLEDARESLGIERSTCPPPQAFRSRRGLLVCSAKSSSHDARFFISNAVRSRKRIDNASRSFASCGGAAFSGNKTQFVCWTSVVMRA